MPLFVVECNDIKTLSNSQIDLLRCGDYLVKKDVSGEHAYKVSYKKDKVGICLTYCDGSGYIETASYDYTGGKWVFNSLDVFNGADLQDEIDDKQDKLVSGTNIKTINSTSLLGSGNIDITGGKQLYEHRIFFDIGDGMGNIQFAFINDISTPYVGEAEEQTICQTLKDIINALGNSTTYYPASVNYDGAITGTGRLTITVNVEQQTYQVSITGCLFDDDSGSPIINFNCNQNSHSLFEIGDIVRTL